MKKSIVCTEEGKILGRHWHLGGLFTAEDKKLKAILALPHAELAEIPAHSIFGLLNFFRCYLPDFAVRTEPLRRLLARSHDEWTEEHTACVKDVISRILGALPVINFNPASPTRLQYRVGPAGLAGVLLQQDPSRPNRWLPIASHSRTLEASELLLSRLELEVRTIWEVLSKLRNMAAYCRHLEIESSPEVR